MAYREPGVQSTFVASPGGENLIGNIRLPAIIGQGSASYTVTELVTRASSGTTDTLAHTATQILQVGNYSTTTDYVLTTDYLLTTGKIDWSPAHTTPTSGQKYYVTYKYAKVSGDYVPKLFDNINDVIAEYGPITYNSSTKLIDVTAYLTLGAYLAFKNGAQQVILAQVNDPTTASSFDDAFTQLEEEVSGQNPNIIVPIFDTLSHVGAPASPFDSGITFAVAHVLKMGAPEYGKERTLFTSLWDGSATTDLITKATAIHNENISVIAPANAIFTASYAGATADCQVGGDFLACAVAGLGVSQDPAEPYTRKLINGFKSLVTPLLTQVQRINLASAGVMVLKQTAGIIRVSQGLTTDPSTVNTSQVTVPQIKAWTIQNVRHACDSYIGKKFADGTTKKIEVTVSNVLEQIVDAEIITKYANVSAKQDPLNPLKAKVSFSILPMYSLDYIDITFTIDLGLLS